MLGHLLNVKYVITWIKKGKVNVKKGSTVISFLSISRYTLYDKLKIKGTGMVS
jgi:hypothetical protein